MSRKPKHNTANKYAGNITPKVPADFAKSEFRRAIGRASDGANSHIENFLTVMDTLTGMKASFTLADFIYYAQPLEIPASESKALFEKWCAVMEKLHKVTIIDGCYNEPLVCLV